MVRQAQEKVPVSGTGRPCEPHTSSDLVTFFRGLKSEDSDGRGPRLRQRTDTCKRRQETNRTEKIFVFSTLFFVLFCFLIVSQLRVGVSCPAGSSCCSGCLGWLCLRSEATLRSPRGPGRGSGEGVGVREVASADRRGRPRRQRVSRLHCCFFFPSGPFQGPRACGRGGWNGRRVGPGPGETGRKREDMGGQPHMSWGCCIASWCAEGYHDV